MKRISKIALSFIFTLAFSLILTSNYVYADESVEEITPLHYYSFDNDTSSIILDSVNSGKVNGSATGVTKIAGYDGTGSAVHFDGNSYISFNNIIVPTGKKSISFKFRKEKASGKVEYFFGNCTNFKTESGISAAISADGYLAIENAQSGPVYTIVSTNKICDNEWHSILYTWDGTTNKDSVKLYIDDMITPNKVGTATFADTSAAKYNFYLGSMTQGLNTKFIGDIDDFKVFDKIYLNTPFDITALANQETKQINVSWSPISNSISYNVYRSETTGEGFVKIGSSTNSSFLDTDPTLEAGKTYYYVITSVNADGESLQSNEASATLLKSNNVLKLVLEKYEIKQLSVSEELEDNTNLTWTSSDATVATVDANGKVKALKPGNTVITCTSEDGEYTDTIKVLVVDLDYQLAVDLLIGEKCRLTVDDAKDTAKVTWTVNDPTIATVTSKGKVTAVGEGLTFITATDEDGKEIGKIFIRVRITE